MLVFSERDGIDWDKLLSDGGFSVHLVPGHKSQKDKERRTNGTEIEKMQKRDKNMEIWSKGGHGDEEAKGELVEPAQNAVFGCSALFLIEITVFWYSQQH